MKIGIVIDRLNVGGVEKIAIEEVKALRKLGEDAYLVVLREKSVVENAFPDLLKNVPIVYLDGRLPKIFKFSFQFPLFHFFSLFHVTYPLLLPFVVKKGEFDYLFSHGTYTTLSIIPIKKFKKIHFSAFIWDPAVYILERVYSNKVKRPVMWFLKKIAGRLDRYLIRNMDSVLVGGSAHNNYIHSIDSEKKINTIYPSVHPLKKLVKKERYILMATAWKRGKNPEYIPEVVKQIPNLQVKMVGKWLEPEYRKEFEKILKENGVSKQVELVGEVTEQELTGYLSRALVVLQTNDDRGFGMPALEAAGAGTTFIIPKGQGVCSLFEDKVDGYYTDEKDTDVIVNCISKLLEDDIKAKNMGEKAWKKVRDSYSWEKHAKQLINVAKNN